jgi:hypothetical protein
MGDFIAVSDRLSAEVQGLVALLKEEYFDGGNPPLPRGKVLDLTFQDSHIINLLAGGQPTKRGRVLIGKPNLSSGQYR